MFSRNGTRLQSHENIVDFFNSNVCHFGISGVLFYPQYKVYDYLQGITSSMECQPRSQIFCERGFLAYCPNLHFLTNKVTRKIMSFCTVAII